MYFFFFTLIDVGQLVIEWFFKKFCLAEASLDFRAQEKTMEERI